MTFPGHIYDGTGRNLVGGPALRQDELDACPHRSLVSDCDAPPVFRVWLLNDDAAPAAIPPSVMSEGVRLVLAGKGVLIVAKRPEVETDVRAGLLRALDLFTALPDDGGRA